MWYNIIFEILTQDLIPTFWRKQKVIAFVRAVGLPVSKIYDKWKVNRERNLYKLNHNGQVCFLRKSLNDTFDPDQRRIYIDDGLQGDAVYINPIISNRPKYLGTLFINPSYFTSGEYDFWVYVPSQIANNKQHELHAHIDYYKEGVKKYVIQNI